MIEKLGCDANAIDGVNPFREIVVVNSGEQLVDTFWPPNKVACQSRSWRRFALCAGEQSGLNLIATIVQNRCFGDSERRFFSGAQ